MSVFKNAAAFFGKPKPETTTDDAPSVFGNNSVIQPPIPALSNLTNPLNPKVPTTTDDSPSVFFGNNNLIQPPMPALSKLVNPLNPRVPITTDDSPPVFGNNSVIQPPIPAISNLAKPLNPKASEFIPAPSRNLFPAPVRIPAPLPAKTFNPPPQLPVHAEEEFDGKIVGLCEEMCPPEERISREEGKDLSIFEMIPGTEKQPVPRVDHSRAIKKYKRSTVNLGEGERKGVDPRLVRTLPTLEKTMTYLLEHIVDDRNHPFREMYNFVRDRTRGIRQDISCQQLQNETVVRIFEQVARFHVIANAKLIGDEDEQQMNLEQLNKCLISLRELYFDLRTQHNFVPQNEPEFQSYFLTSQLLLSKKKRNESNTEDDLMSLPDDILNSPHIRLFTEIWKAVQSFNYYRYFKLMREADPLTASLMYIWSNGIRKMFVERIARYSAQQYEIAEITSMLAFSNDAETLSFLENSVSELQVVGTKVTIPKNSYFASKYAKESMGPWLEEKLVGSTLSAIIQGEKMDQSRIDAINEKRRQLEEQRRRNQEQLQKLEAQKRIQEKLAREKIEKERIERETREREANLQREKIEKEKRATEQKEREEKERTEKKKEEENKLAREKREREEKEKKDKEEKEKKEREEKERIESARREEERKRIEKEREAAAEKKRQEMDRERKLREARLEQERREEEKRRQEQLRLKIWREKLTLRAVRHWRRFTATADQRREVARVQHWNTLLEKNGRKFIIHDVIIADDVREEVSIPSSTSSSTTHEIDPSTTENVDEWYRRPRKNRVRPNKRPRTAPPAPLDSYIDERMDIDDASTQDEKDEEMDTYEKQIQQEREESEVWLQKLQSFVQGGQASELSRGTREKSQSVEDLTLEIEKLRREGEEMDRKMNALTNMGQKRRISPECVSIQPGHLTSHIHMNTNPKLERKLNTALKYIVESKDAISPQLPPENVLLRCKLMKTKADTTKKNSAKSAARIEPLYHSIISNLQFQPQNFLLQPIIRHFHLTPDALGPRVVTHRDVLPGTWEGQHRTWSCGLGTESGQWKEFRGATEASQLGTTVILSEHRRRILPLVAGDGRPHSISRQQKGRDHTNINTHTHNMMTTRDYSLAEQIKVLTLRESSRFKRGQKAREAMKKLKKLDLSKLETVWAKEMEINFKSDDSYLFDD
ncbi:hypothetical protein PROFUN_01421 [Planoprotostelium fungivorum]|uniref:SAC3/GANP/THP3 conserved domain-containing protein n=1 Tax=Planoprotostelium fungivorum TaxID=1890364 RepID=A0A2P6NT58_9EUKA|nr:hypothetical protein PROFUN_01421 [Planoprotostelium fungivorum]